MRRTDRVSHAAAIAVATLSISMLTGCDDAPTDAGSSVMVGLSDRYPSDTPQDWVTYADFAAEVEVVSETRTDPTSEDLKRGEGDLQRTVTLGVEDVLWRAPDGVAPPRELDYSALGYQFADGDAKTLQPMIAADRPRVEVGHRYVMAFRWQDERCYEGDGVIPAHWNGLGAGSELPYDNGAIGVGEFAGTDRSLETARTAARAFPNDSIAAQTVGLDASAVTALLTIATPGEEGDFGPTPSDC